MANRCAWFALILLWFVLPVAGGHAQTLAPAQDVHASPSGAAGSDNLGASGSPPINTGAIVKRVNKELGVNLSQTTDAWGRELNGLEADLQHPGLRYSELNAYRDELQRLRSQVEDLSQQLQTRLDAAQTQP